MSSAKRKNFKLPDFFQKDLVWKEVILAERPLFWITGAGYCGKTTLSQFLADATNFYLINPRNQTAEQSSSSITVISNKYDTIKKEMKRTYKHYRGYIMDDFPSTMKECRKFERKLFQPNVVIYVQISLDAVLQRILSKNPTVDLNAARVAYVKRVKFAEKLVHRYEVAHKVIRVFSQYPMQEMHAKVMEILETEFSYKFSKGVVKENS